MWPGSGSVADTVIPIGELTARLSAMEVAYVAIENTGAWSLTGCRISILMHVIYYVSKNTMLGMLGVHVCCGL